MYYLEKKMIPKSARLQLWVQKSKMCMEQTIIKIGQSSLSMQAVPLVGSIF